MSDAVERPMARTQCPECGRTSFAGLPFEHTHSMGKPMATELFDEEFLQLVLDMVQSSAGGTRTLSVDKFPSAMHVLAAGYLAGQGYLKIVSGGGKEPYVLGVTDMAEFVKFRGGKK